MGRWKVGHEIPRGSERVKTGGWTLEGEFRGAKCVVARSWFLWIEIFRDWARRL